MYVPMQTLERAVRLVDEVADLDNPADFAAVALPRLAELIRCDVVTYNEVGRRPSEVRYEDWPPGSLDPTSRELFANLVYQHPLVSFYRRTGDGKPVMISDFLDTRQFHRLALYAEFFRTIPVEHQLAVTLSDGRDTVIGLALSRARREFDETDRAVLAAVRGPLTAALMRARTRHSSAIVFAQLTDRELAILQLVSLGRTNVAIGHALSISSRTVAKHLEHIYRKLDVTNRAAAVARAR
jgi:DNA-binding CsgD family transcriptional regulator